MIPVWIVIGKVASVPGCVDRSGRYQVAGLSADRTAIEIAVGFSHKYLHKPFPGTLSQSPAPAGRRARWQPRRSVQSRGWVLKHSHPPDKREMGTPRSPTYELAYTLRTLHDRAVTHCLIHTAGKGTNMID